MQGEINHTDRNQQISIVILYEHIAHPGSGECRKTHTLHSFAFLYVQLTHTALSLAMNR